MVWTEDRMIGEHFPKNSWCHEPAWSGQFVFRRSLPHDLSNGLVVHNVCKSTYWPKRMPSIYVTALSHHHFRHKLSSLIVLLKFCIAWPRNQEAKKVVACSAFYLCTKIAHSTPKRCVVKKLPNILFQGPATLLPKVMNQIGWWPSLGNLKQLKGR